MSHKIYGYIRVSSKDQNEARQMVALQEYGVAPDKIFMDKQSGKNFERSAYKELIEKLKPGDMLVIKSIDRLGRNYDETIDQWRLITKEIKADIAVLDLPLLNTRQRSADLTGTFIADLVLQILSYVAQTEREAIRQRQAEGIAIAKANGVRFGRRPVELPPEFEALHREYISGELSLREAAERAGMSKSTFHRRVQAASKKSCPE